MTEVWDTHACTNAFGWRTVDQWESEGRLAWWRCQCGDPVWSIVEARPTRERPTVADVREAIRGALGPLATEADIEWAMEHRSDEACELIGRDVADDRAAMLGWEAIVSATGARP
ncbi:MAG: hypothetical protein GY708_04665 [Actinomycetia bacterium]|nr:hypothetical protein [Actinomycetes bacterium]